MEKKKIVSIDVEAMKDRATGAAKDAAASVGARIAQVGKAASDLAKSKKDKAFAMVLDKGIELSEKQLKVLEKARATKD